LIAVQALDVRITGLENTPPPQDTQSLRLPATPNIMALRIQRTALITKMNFELTTFLDGYIKTNPADIKASLIRYEVEITRLIRLDRKICKQERLLNM